MDKIELLLEAERRGILPADKALLLNEARSRGLVPAQSVVSNSIQKDDGFFSRVGEDLNRRGEMFKETLGAYDRGEQGALESLFQGSMNVGVGGGLDVLGQGVASAGRGLSALIPDVIEDPIRSAGASALEGIGKLPVYSGGSLGQQLPQDVQKISRDYQSFAEKNPRAARNIGALGNLAQVFPASKGVKGVLGAADKATDATAQGVKAVSSKIPFKKGIMASDDVRDYSSKFYKAADEAGGIIDEEKSFDMFEKMSKEVLPTDLKDLKAVSKESYVKTLKDLENAYLGEPLSLQNLVNIDKRLTAEAQKFTVSDPNAARLVKKMQGAVRDTMNNVTPENMIGGKDGFKMYKEGRDLYAKSKRMETIENIVAHAEEAAQPSTAIKNGLRTLRKRIREGKVKGYTPEEIKMLDKAISSAGMEGALRALGSRFTSGVATGAAFGSGLNPLGVAAAGALIGTGALSRAGAEAIKKGKVKKLIKTIQPEKLRAPDALLEIGGGR